jgi:hypothetical protein
MHDEASKLVWYSENRPHNNYMKHVNIIDSNSCVPLENWEKNVAPPRKKGMREPSIIEETTTIKEGAHQARGKATTEAHSRLCSACIMDSTPITVPKIA